MIRADEIQERLLHLIGWEQNYDTTNLRIADSLTESESGLYFQQVHPLLTLQNMACVAPDFQNAVREKYSLYKAFRKGDVVDCDGTFYRALQDSEGVPPTKDWEEPPDATVCDLVYRLEQREDGSYVRKGEPERVNCREYDSRRKAPVLQRTDRDTAGMRETEVYALVSTGSAPAPYDPDGYWAETDLFSEWLEKKTKAGIYKAVMRFVTEKMSAGAGKALCENRALFDGTGRIGDTVRNRGRFVGFEIVPVRSMGVTLKINRIGLQFTKPGKYMLYLFHSGQSEPVRVMEVEKKVGNGAEWFAFDDLYLPYISGSNDAGGSWYLGYFQDDLPAGSEAVRRDRDWSKGPCRSCSRNEYLLWESWSRYLEVHPFAVDGGLVRKWYKAECIKVYKITGNTVNGEEERKLMEVRDCVAVPYGTKVTYRTERMELSPTYTADVETPIIPEGTEKIPMDGTFDVDALNTGPDLWDIGVNDYTYDNNYGLNLEVSVGCDLTDFIIEQRAVFQDVIAKQVAVDMLREFAFNANVRTNRHSVNASRTDILYEIDGDSSSMKKSGLGWQLDQAYRALDVDTRGIDRICMPCRNNGVKYRTV